MTEPTIYNSDCLTAMRTMEDDSVDLVFTSPPYEDCRLYGDLNFKLKGDDWVDWAFERYVECLRVCRGLVAWVVEGKTRQFTYSATPFRLMVRLQDAGYKLRKPPVFHRVGIAGSGGPDWLRNDWEPIICATKRGKLPWSDNTAMGHPPKWGPGGVMSHRRSDGARVNQWGHSINSGATVVDKGGVVRSKGRRPSHVEATAGPDYTPPKLANPGNVIKCLVGGGVMGNKLCHENEAPFPEALAEFFVRSFCPPGGTALDPFCGSGTTLAVAERFGRKSIGVDARDDQCRLTLRRLAA